MAANSQFSVAVHVLAVLARHTGEKVKSEMIAGSVNTNAVVIRRLLGQLGNAGLVESWTGAAGGTRLARSAEKISLAEVYNAVSCGEVFALHGRSPDQDCPVGRNIEAVLCGLQKEIDRAVTGKLSQYTMENILEIIEQGKG